MTTSTDKPVAGAAPGAPSAREELPPYGRSRAWSVSFRVVDRRRKRFTMSSDQQRRLLDALAGSAPVITNLDRGFAVTFNVLGDFDECVMRGTESLWTALEAARLEGFTIANARMVNHEDFDRKLDGEAPVYLGITECAMALELSKQRISQLVHAGEFPQPDAFVGSRPAWLESTVRILAAARRRRP